MKKMSIICLAILYLSGCKTFVEYVPDQEETNLKEGLFTVEVSVRIGAFAAEFDDLQVFIYVCPSSSKVISLNCANREVDINSIKLTSYFPETHQKFELVRTPEAYYEYSSSNFKNTWRANEQMSLEVQFDYDSLGNRKHFRKAYPLNRHKRTVLSIH